MRNIYHTIANGKQSITKTIPKMKKNNWIFGASFFLLLACNTSSNLYQSEKTKGVDFKKYKTYAWLATKDTAYTKLANKKNVEHALATEVIKQLSERGMLLDTLHPDCLFTYTLVMNKTYEVGNQPNEVYNTQVYAPVYPGQANIYYYHNDYGPSGEKKRSRLTGRKSYSERNCS